MKEAGVADLKKDLQGMKAEMNSTMSQANSAATPTISVAPRKNDFDKFFGESPEAGETRVAGVAVSNA
jgi:hypothetical protein